MIGQAIHYIVKKLIILIFFLPQLHPAAAHPKTFFFPLVDTQGNNELYEDLESVGIRDPSYFQSDVAVSYALIHTCAPSTKLHDRVATMKHILLKKTTDINYKEEYYDKKKQEKKVNRATPLCTIVHGTFNAPVELVKLLIEAKATAAHNPDAACILLKSTKYLQTLEDKKNATSVLRLLLANNFPECREYTCLSNKLLLYVKKHDAKHLLIPHATEKPPLEKTKQQKLSRRRNHKKSHTQKVTHGAP